jgi:hypothetical protein
MQTAGTGYLRSFVRSEDSNEPGLREEGDEDEDREDSEKIARILGGRGGAISKEVGVDAEVILNALTANDYHDNWFFSDPNSIKILSIDDCTGEPTAPWLTVGLEMSRL